VAAAAGLLAAGLLGAGTGGLAGADEPASDGTGGHATAQARAMLVDPSGAPVGTAMFVERHGGVEIALEVHGVEPGRHGLHLHANGACAPGPDPSGAIIPFGAAGGHFDPGATMNHDAPEAPPTVGHAGDVPNIDVDEDGNGHLVYLNPDVSLAEAGSGADHDAHGIVGRSIVLHAGEDDYMTDPAGASGARIACGVIEEHEDEEPGEGATSYALPGDNTFPEGIATLPGGGFVVGSVTDGTIYHVNEAGEVSVFSPGGTDGRNMAVGMTADAKGRLYVAGGANGTVSVLDVDGSPIATLSTPEADARFINDVAVSHDGWLYATDSMRPVVFRAYVGGDEPGPLEAWLDLDGTPLAYQEGFNLNGIVVSESGSFLVTVQSNTGRLWRITTATGEVEEIDTEGQTFPGGDGLVLVNPEEGSDERPTLYVIQNALSTITRLELDPAGRWVEQTGQIVDPALLFPTTGAQRGDVLLVVNGQLDLLMGGSPVLPFTVSAIPVSRFDDGSAS
jgi:Cu-Zn family superoxide dismutase